MTRMTGTAQFFSTRNQQENAAMALAAWAQDVTQVILTDGYGFYAVGSEDFTHRAWDMTCPEELEALLKN